MNKALNKTLIASAIGLSLMGAGTANASLVTNVMGAGPGTFSTIRANFSMLDSTGAIVGGTNDVNMVWDGNAYNSSSDYTGPGSPANVTATSPTTFFGNTWTANTIQVFTPGTYSFDTSLGTTNAPLMQTMVVGSSQLGMHMLFNWSTSANIDVVVVANQGAIFGSGNTSFANASTCTGAGSNCLWAGAVIPGGAAFRPGVNKVWMLASVDQAGGDGTPGTSMIDGPFVGFNANFNADLAFTPAAVPVPAAAWLFGSGLMGLAAVARRKKKA